MERDTKFYLLYFEKRSVTYPPTRICEMQLAISNSIITLSIVFTRQPLHIQKYYTHFGKWNVVYQVVQRLDKALPVITHYSWMHVWNVRVNLCSGKTYLYHNFLQTNVLVFLIRTYKQLFNFITETEGLRTFAIVVTHLRNAIHMCVRACTYVRARACMCARARTCLAQTRNCIYSAVCHGS
jgi:hypothetical protein